MSRRVKLLTLFGQITLALLISVLLFKNSYAEPVPLPVTVEEKIEQIDIVGTLTEENQIEFSKIIGYTIDYDSSEIPEAAVIMREFELSNDSIFAINSIKVSELITNRNFTRMFKLAGDCDGQFTFDQSTSEVQICMRPQPQIRLEFDGVILDKRNLSTAIICGNPALNYPLENYFSTELPVFDYPYTFTATAKGGDGVALNAVNQSACQSKPVDLRVNKLNGGFYCQGIVLPKLSELKAEGKKNPSISNIMNLAGNNTKEIENIERAEIARLQKESINASISASNAAVTSKNASIWSAILTGVIAFLTFINIKTTNKVIDENRKSNKPVIKVKPEPLGMDKVILKIVNIGKSSAVDVSVSYQVLPNGRMHQWNVNLLQENDSARLFPEEVGNLPFAQFMNTYELIKVKSSWKDPHSHFYSEDYEISLKGYKQALDENLWILDTTFKEDVEQISRKTKEIADTLKLNALKVKVEDVKLNPQKFEDETALFKKLYAQKEAAFEKLKSQNEKEVK